MRTPTSLALAVVGVAVLGAAWYYGRTPGDTPPSAVAGQLAFPGLAPKLEGATEVDVVHQGQTMQVVDHDGVWGLPSKGGYPIEQGKLHALLTALTELRLTEPRTSDPAEYARLGVEDPNAPAAGSNLLRVLDGAGKTLAELIVGHRRVRTQGNTPETVYVRLPGEAQSWLAEGQLEVDGDPQLWIDRDIANIDHAKIASATVTVAGASPAVDQTLVFARKGDSFALAAPADHPKLDDYKVEDVARAFETLTLLDVKPAAQEPGTKEGASTFTTTDGETIVVTVFKVTGGKDPEIWAQFAPTGTGSEAMAKRVGGWTYQVGSWKEAAFLPTIDALKSTEAAPAASPPAGSAAPAAAPAPQ